VLSFPQGNGLKLSPTTGVVSNSAYTIVVLFEFDSVDGFRRIIDFKNGTSDRGLYVHDGDLAFFPHAAGTTTPIAANNYVQVVITRDSGGLVRGYVDGVQWFQFPDTSKDAVIGANNVLRFFKDNVSGGGLNEHSAGSVARIRLYNGALASDEIQALDRTEPTAFVVNSTFDGEDNNTWDGKCFTGDISSGTEKCTLRAAIQQANATSGKDTIKFNIPGGPGVKTITPSSELPDITQAVIIDGYTQPGASANTLANGTNAALMVELNGAGFNLASRSGLGIAASNTTVRGLIINRWDSAVRIERGTRKNVISGNFLGTDSSGNQDLGNGNGVVVQGASHTVGGAAPGLRNLISGNQNGVAIYGSGNNKVLGNLIGTKFDGTSLLGNSADGVRIFESPNNTIGGSVSARNIIAFNGFDGVRILGSQATRNRVLSNSIYSNGDLGINLDQQDYVTPNDNGPPPDADAGANNLQNFPVISEVLTSNASTTVRGSLKSTPNRSFTLQFFYGPNRDASGFGEGQAFLDQKTVTTNASGNASFDFALARKAPAGLFLTATATDANGNTSEFCRARLVSSFD